MPPETATPFITLPQLSALLDGGASVTLLDVRLPEDHACGHVPESVNHCVFEMVFTEKVTEAVPDKESHLILVGWGGISQEAEVATQKLTRAGYRRVQILQGGIAGWTEAKLPLEKLAPTPPAPEWPVGRRGLDLNLCHVEWLGRNLLNKHFGTVPIREGYLDFDTEGPLCGGQITLDLTGLTCTDLAGTPMHDVLIAHLQGDDFFDVERYPTAVLSITKATRIAETPGSPNLEITADLTLRGMTHSICFLTSGGLTSEGRPAAQAALAIDRTRWGVIYGSGKFFQRLMGHLVNDRIEFSVKLVTL